MAAYTTIDDPEAYFQVKLYTGTGSEIAATLDGDTNMSPNLVAIKARTDAESHKVYDSVRGVTKHIEFDTGDAEATESEGLKSFDSDGFTIGTYSSINASDSHTYVAWCWKESATSGFDIVSYTGNGSARAISHSLSAVPSMMLVKNRGSGYGWQVYHHSNTSAPETEIMYLHDTNATADSNVEWNDTAPTSSVFTVGTDVGVNQTSTAMIAYLFTNVQGFSKFGSYVGNGNADGPYIHLGFRPAYILIKRTDSTGDWYIFDNKLIPQNVITQYLTANKNEAVKNAVAAYYIDFLSNGFKLRGTGNENNADGGTYIYAAFAEAPFVNSEGVPCNAR